MNVDTDALRWLQQVADGTTVTEVSELEPVTQSGVSRALARLEAQIGTPLLRRSGRTLRMTHAGAVFKPHLDAMLHHLDDGVAAVNQLIDPDTGTVALAFQPSLGTWLVPDLARSFRTAHPGVRFRLTQVRDEPNSAALDGGHADLELGSRRPQNPPDVELRTRLIALEPLRLALPREHPLVGRPPRAGRPAGARPAGRGGERAVHRPAGLIRAAAAGRPAVRAGRVPARRDLRGRRPVQRPRFRRGRPGRGGGARAPRRIAGGGARPGGLPGDPRPGRGPGDLPDLVRRTPPAARHRPVPPARHPPRRGQPPPRGLGFIPNGPGACYRSPITRARMSARAASP